MARLPHIIAYILPVAGIVMSACSGSPHGDVAHEYVGGESCGRRMFVTADGKCGYLDTDSVEVIAPRYDVAFDFADSVAVVGVGDESGAVAYSLIDTAGRVVAKIPAGTRLLSSTAKDGGLQFIDYTTGQRGRVGLDGTVETMVMAPAASEAVAVATASRITETVAVVQPADWQSVARDNPFYHEAKKVIAGGLDETDARNRRLILDYVEHLRMAYMTKDIDFIDQVFSTNALIIVGNVVHSVDESHEDAFMVHDRVIYNVRSKREYIGKLRALFASNDSISLQFDDFAIRRHPTVAGIYGVGLKQAYRSDRYSDKGYLFLLWDFRDEAMPKIHVRTWQPLNPDGAGHSPTESELFSISDFNLD